VKLWKNTKTLDDYIDSNFIEVEDKELAEIVLLGSKPIDLDEFPNLKGIFRAGVGKENIDFDKCMKHGIEVCFPSESTKNIIYEETANFACHLILKASYANTGEIESWTKNNRPFLRERKLLIIGVGNIGKSVYRKMKSFMTCLKYDSMDSTPDELNKLLVEADFVSLHIPSTPTTENFIDAEKLAMMKDGAVLINTARGKVVDEDSLYNELINDRIRAYFDVFWQEPYNGKLKELENFYMTPHIASTCDGFLRESYNDMVTFKNFIKE